ncbi:MAG: SWIM zinc finger family protein [Myxococcales bacterium]|nr:SWIM zinc finger family protein [Myxococcales bacterium]
MAWNRRRSPSRERSSYRGDRGYGGPGPLGEAADELAELEELLARGEPEQESLGAIWRSRVVGWGADSARRTRGRELLGEGAVGPLRVEAGRIVAEVAGSRVYTVQLVVRPPSRWERESMRELLLTPADARHPGALTSDGLILLDALVRTMVVTCTCPDGWGCKHAVAAVLAFADRLDAESTALLVLWGMAEAAVDDAFTLRPLAPDRVALTGDLGALFGIDLVVPDKQAPGG